MSVISGHHRHTRLARSATAVLVGATIATAYVGTARAAASTRTDATTVTVTFTKSRFSVSRPGAPSGTVTFMVINKTPTLRVLKIVGPGVRGSRSLPVPPGKSATLTLPVSKGAYMLLDTLSRPPSAHWLVVTPAANVSATGNGSVVTPITVTTGMNCD
jgi:hypothetical protein